MENDLVRASDVDGPRLVLHYTQKLRGWTGQPALVNQGKGRRPELHHRLIEDVVVIEDRSISESERVAVALSPHLVRVKLISVRKFDSLSQVKRLRSSVSANRPIRS